MRKVIPVLLLLLFLFTGCRALRPDPASAESSESTGETSVETSTETSVESGSGSESSAEPSVPSEPRFFEERTLREGTQSLYEVPLNIETQAHFVSMNRFVDLYLFLFYTKDEQDKFALELYLYDMEQLSVEASTVLNGFTQLPLLQVIGGKIALLSSNTGTLQVLNSDLTPYETFELGEIPPDGECILSADCKTLYTLVWNDRIIATDLASMHSQTFLSGLAETYGSDVSGTRRLFTYLDPETRFYVAASLDLDTGVIERQPFECDSSWVFRCGDTWLSEMYGNPECWLIGDSAQALSFRSEAYYHSLAAPDRILIEDENGKALYRFDGTFVGRIEKPDDVYHTEYLYSEAYAGYFFLEVKNAGTGTLMFWSPDDSAQSEPLALEPVKEETVPEGAAVSERLYERAREIGETYGVEMRIADQCPTQYSGFECEQMLDEDTIEAALEQLDAALSRYPEKFISQLSCGHYPKTRIDLVCSLRRSADTLPPEDEEVNGYTSVDAFVSNLTGDCHLIVMNIENELMIATNLYHEFSHVIDNVLEWDAGQRKDALYSEEDWKKCSPDDFEYAYDYYYLPDEFFYDSYDDYFVDVYARTFPTEDRARILEYAMASPDYLAMYDGMLGKLRYYSACIRDAFDTTGWPEYTQWEIPLELKENGTYGGEDYYDDAA